MRLVKGLEDPQLRQVFEGICDVLIQANFELIDYNHIETMEFHLKDTNYSKYAFASVQCYGGKYVELRFPRRHLIKFRAYQFINAINGYPWRNDNTKYIRFHFRNWTPESFALTDYIARVLRKNIKPVTL